MCASERRSAAGVRRADAEGGRTAATAGVPACDRPRFVCAYEVCGRARRARPTRRATRVDEGRRTAAARPEVGRTAGARLPRPIRNGPQPRSWGKPGRDAKSVVPGLRPGDRRARRRWPAAAGVFWRREPVSCETVTGVVIGYYGFSRRGPAGWRDRDAGRRVPLGVRDGSAAETWTCTGRPERARTGPRSPFPEDGAAGTPAGAAAATDASASASPVALLSWRDRRTVVGVTPTSVPLTNLQNVGFYRRPAWDRRVVAHPARERSAISARSGVASERSGAARTGRRVAVRREKNFKNPLASTGLGNPIRFRTYDQIASGTRRDRTGR